MCLPDFCDCYWIAAVLFQVGPASPALNPGPLSWDRWCWTSDHGPWVRVTTYTRCFIIICCSVLTLCLHFIFFVCFWSLGALSGGGWGRLGNHWGAIWATSEHFRQVKRTNDCMGCAMVDLALVFMHQGYGVVEGPDLAMLTFLWFCNTRWAIGLVSLIE